MATKMYELYMSDAQIDEAFFIEALTYMLEKEPFLKDYIKDILFTEEETKSLSEYSKDERKIYIHPNVLVGRIGNTKMIPLLILRHELEHARNLRTLLAGEKDIESIVIACANRDYLYRHDMLERIPRLDKYDQSSFLSNKVDNYKYNPDERLANIRAWKYLVNLLKNQRKSDELLTARLNLTHAYKRGYDLSRNHIISPTYRFLQRTKLLSDLYRMKYRVEDKDYCFDTRLMYGLPLSEDEVRQKVYTKSKLPERYRYMG